MQQNQKKIYNRMVKNASKIWGHSEMDIDSSFDPIVGMMLGALSSELSKLYAENSSAKTEIIEKLLEIVTPEANIGPFASHAISSAQPIEATTILKKQHQFYTKIRLDDKFDPINTIQKTVHFSPCGQFKLLNVTPKAYIYGANYVTIDEDGDPITKKNVVAGNQTNTLRIGLDVQDLTNLNGLGFYFDTLLKQDRDLFLYHLKTAKWSIFGNPIEVRQGYQDDNEDEWYNLDKVLDNRLGNSDIQEKNVRNHYRKHFINIKNSATLTKLDAKNAAFYNTLFASKTVPGTPKELTWLEIEFNEVISEKTLQEVHFSVNAFPVMNRQFKKTIFRVGEYFNYFKLKDNNHYFDLEKVSLTDGTALTRPIYNKASNLEDNQVLVRFSGVGRLDSRSALEYIEHVVDLVREESAAFRAYGDEAIKTHLKELLHTISRIESRVENNVQKQESSSPFLVVKVLPQYVGDSIFAEYWTTDGQEGNRILAGRTLKQYKGNDIVPASCKLLTTTIGGQEKLNGEEKLYTYRYHLLSRNRIVSKQDLAALCLKVFSGNIKKLNFEKGLRAGHSSTAGYERTLDIHIALKNNLAEDDWDYKCAQILQNIENDGIYAIPCRVFKV